MSYYRDKTAKTYLSYNDKTFNNIDSTFLCNRFLNNLLLSNKQNSHKSFNGKFCSNHEVHFPCVSMTTFSFQLFAGFVVKKQSSTKMYEDIFNESPEEKPTKNYDELDDELMRKLRNNEINIDETVKTLEKLYKGE